MSGVNILYFASFREKFGQAQEQLPAEFGTVGELLAKLAQRGDEWRETLIEQGRVQIAVNQDMANTDTPLKAGDEVALFPPVTGG